MELIGRYNQSSGAIPPVMMEETRAQRLAVVYPDMIVFVAPLLHEWIRDEVGHVADFGQDPHTGPECIRCGETFCQFCFPQKWEEPCQEQTFYLF